MMNHSWDNVFEFFKERRLAGIYFGTFGVSLGVLLLLVFIYQSTGLNLLQYWPLFLVGLGLLLTVFFWRAICHARQQRKNRYKSSPLSRDELMKARSKLRTNSSGKAV